MSAYGYERETTPFVEQLASDAVVFDRAIAASSWTRPSVASLLTSTHVHSHQMDAGTGLLRTGVTTIAERFREAGYPTAGFVTNAFLTSYHGFEQGFSHFDDLLARRTAYSHGLSTSWLRWGFRFRGHSTVDGRRRRGGELNRRFFEWFDANQSPGGFVWLHYMDSHDPYWSPAESPQFGETMPDRYDSAIRYWDASLKDLVTYLQDRGVWESATMVLTSDHGEEFWEHGRRGHGRTLYDEVIHVPLMVKDPRATPRRVTTTVSLVDVAPTLVELAGLEPLPIRQGRSLVPYLAGAAVERGPVISELLRAHDRVQLAVIDHPWKLILRPDSGEVELFHLEDDPGEQNPLPAPNPDIVRSFLEGMRPWPVDVIEPRPPSPDSGAERPRVEALEALEALGYLSPG